MQQQNMYTKLICTVVHILIKQKPIKVLSLRQQHYDDTNLGSISLEPSIRI